MYETDNNIESSEKTFKSYGLGLPIILVMIVVLSLLTFAVISYMTAKNSYSNEVLSKNSMHQMIETENRANKWIMDIVAKNSLESITDRVDKVKNENNDSSEESYLLRKTFKINKKKKLDVLLRVKPRADKFDYEIVRWQTVNTEDFSEEQTLKGMD